MAKPPVRRRRAPRETYSQALSRLGKGYIENTAISLRLESKEEALHWLKAKSTDFLKDRLSLRESEVFEFLLGHQHQLGFGPYWLRSFEHPHLSPAASTKCARMYGIPRKLQEDVKKNPRVIDRDLIFAAWKLGLITDDEFRAMPPKISKTAFRSKRVRFRKRRNTKNDRA